MMRNPLTRGALVWKLLVCACWSANLTLCGPGAKFSLSSGITGDIALSRRRKHRLSVDLSRRKFLQSLGQGAACSFLPAVLGFLPFSKPFQIRSSSPSAAEFHVHPHYRAPRELENLFKQVQAGFDAFVTDKYQDAVAGILGGGVECATSGIATDDRQYCQGHEREVCGWIRESHAIAACTGRFGDVEGLAIAVRERFPAATSS